MAAVLADRARLALNQLFIDRMTGAVLVVANTVGSEAVVGNTERFRARTRLITRVLEAPPAMGAIFARAAAGNAMADTFANAAGTDDVKQAAITDTTLTTYVTAAWEIVAGVEPTTRGQ